MKYKRSFIFIRPSTDIQFYSDTTDFVGELRAVVPHHIVISSGYQGPNIHYVSFWFPDFSDYEWFTQNLYIQGQLKLIFREAMIYAKTNRLAFCLPSVNLQNTPALGITRHWYYNIKPSHKKLYDATPEQKQALNLLTHIMTMPDSVHSATFFDFDHNIKLTENAFKGTISPDILSRRLLKMEQKLFKDYSTSKERFNQENQISSFTQIDHIDRTSSKFDLVAIQHLLPSELHTTVLDLEL